jgi:DNA polymerase
MSAKDLERVRAEAAGCRRCDLYENATQTVFGDGDPDARLMVLGEQPGDQEDRKGEPFVGPAGGLLWKALAEVSIDRSDAYVTNAVKHFRFTREERGKRRLHKTPNRTQIVACRPWLIAELQLVDPKVLLCLGATAAKAVLGPSFKLTEHRGEQLTLPPLEAADAENSEANPQPVTIATVHPSAVLRAPDRDEAYESFVADLRVAAKALNQRTRR